MRRPSSSSGEPEWGSFPDTVLHFHSTPAFSLDLRQDVAEAVRVGLRRLGFERSFGILSAQDPLGVPQAPDVNAGLAARLQAEVERWQAAQLCLDACSPDRSHCERSVAIALDLQSVISIACRYNQLAIFWFDGAAFWIVPARSGNARLRLPVRA